MVINKSLMMIGRKKRVMKGKKEEESSHPFSRCNKQGMKIRMVLLGGKKVHFAQKSPRFSVFPFVVK